MQSLNELIGQHPSPMDALTGTVVAVTVITFAVILILTLRKMHVENKKESYVFRFKKWIVYTISFLVAAFLSFNIGSTVFLSNQLEAGKDHHEKVVHAAIQDIQENFDVEDVELHEHYFRGDYYGVEAIMSTAEDTYHTSFMYDKETDAMVPQPTSDTPIEDLPVTAGSTMESIVDEYEEFRGTYLHKMYTLEDNDNSGRPVVSSGNFIASIILSSIEFLVFGFIVFNKRATNPVVTVLGIGGVIFSCLVLMLMGIPSNNSSPLKDARIQNIEHNYEIVSGDYKTRDGRGIRGNVIFKGSTDTKRITFEYIEPFGHMIAVKDGDEAKLRPGSPLDKIVTADD